MDERLRGKGLWLGLGALAIIFLCIMLCGFGAMASFTMGRGPVYVQPPASAEGAAPPPAYNYGHGSWAMGQHGGFNPFAFLFMLMLFGFLLLLLVGFVKHVFWGAGHWAPRYWGPHYWGRSPGSKEWKGRPHGTWGPWAWHCHGEHWGPKVEPTAEEGEPEGADAPDAVGMESNSAE